MEKYIHEADELLKESDLLTKEQEIVCLLFYNKWTLNGLARHLNAGLTKDSLYNTIWRVMRKRPIGVYLNRTKGQNGTYSYSIVPAMSPTEFFKLLKPEKKPKNKKPSKTPKEKSQGSIKVEGESPNAEVIGEIVEKAMKADKKIVIEVGAVKITINDQA